MSISVDEHGFSISYLLLFNCNLVHLQRQWNSRDDVWRIAVSGEYSNDGCDIRAGVARVEEMGRPWQPYTVENEGRCVATATALAVKHCRSFARQLYAQERSVAAVSGNAKQCSSSLTCCSGNLRHLQRQSGTFPMPKCPNDLSHAFFLIYAKHSDWETGNNT